MKLGLTELQQNPNSQSLVASSPLKLVKLGPKKAKYTVEQIVDVLGPQFHDDIAETSCNATASESPCEKVSAAVTKWAGGIGI